MTSAPHVIVTATLVALGGVLGAGGAGAQDDAREVSIVAEDMGCPAAGPLARVLGSMLPRHRVAVGAAAGIRVTIDDLGPRYRVRVKDVDRVLDDPARRCPERARAAAVIAALAIAPPGGANDSGRDRGVDRDAAATVPAAPSHPSVRVAIEAGTVVDAAPFASAGAEPATAFVLRASVGGRHLRFVASAGLASPTSIDLGVGSARLWRVPFDVGLRAAAHWGAFSLRADVGVAATVLRVEGQGLDGAGVDTRLDWGVRIAATLQHWMSARVGWFVGPELWVGARTYELSVAPAGVVRTTARMRLGGSAGVAFRLQ